MPASREPFPVQDLAIPEAQRRLMRARQLAAAGRMSAAELDALVRGAGLDPPGVNAGRGPWDMAEGRRPLDWDHQNQVAGDTAFNEVKPDAANRAGVHPLADEDTRLEERERRRDRLAALETIPVEGAIRASDRTLTAFDNQMQACWDSLQTLLLKARELKTVLDAEPEPDPKEYAAELVSILDSAVLPWMAEADDVLSVLVDATEEGQEVERDKKGRSGG